MRSGASEAKSCALACVEKCEPDVRVIFKQILSVVVLNLSPIPAQAPKEESRLRTLLTRFFPGETSPCSGHPR